MFEGDEHAKEKAMRDALLACMGWMIGSRDHSAHEIQTAAKSFGLAYQAGPTSYKQIKPGDEAFLEKLRMAQAARGFKMPDEYLSTDHIRESSRIKTSRSSGERYRATQFKSWINSVF